MKTDPETTFFSGLIELQYGLDVNDEMKFLAQKIKWANGWPENKTAFWNAEAFMWNHKITAKKRAMIQKELSFLQGKKNLDLGCGSYSYVYSVGVDISEKMLLFNDHCFRKVMSDLEQKLPFKSGSFDSATIVFGLNYIINYQLLIKEIQRILVKNGVLMVVLSSKGINEWQRQKEVNSFTIYQWISVLSANGFKINHYEKEGISFFKCVK